MRRHLRKLGRFVIVIPCALPALAAAPAHATDLSSACTVQLPLQRTQTFRCVVPAAASARAVRFEADFSGSHDDTELALNVRVDGALVTCGAGSRPKSDREDGDVRLVCALPPNLRPTAGAAAVEVEVYRYHAEPAGWRFLAE